MSIKTLESTKSAIPVKRYLDIKDLVIPEDEELTNAILQLKEEKNAVILSHYYQPGEIQDIADFLGDSLQLVKQAKETNADMIVFCGVYFMAETAKILNPAKKVVFPDITTEYSLADHYSAEGLRKIRKQYPDALVAAYINSDLEAKAESDVIVTSSNAEAIIEVLPKNLPIIFYPNNNFGNYLSQKTGHDMILWGENDIVHETFSVEKIIQQLRNHPDAKLITHPENEKAVLKLAHFIGSTSALLNYVEKDSCQKYIVAAEEGILHEMKKRAPHKELIFAWASHENSNTSEYFHMKQNAMEKLYLCMKYELPEIIIEEELRIKALKSIENMLNLSKDIE